MDGLERIVGKIEADTRERLAKSEENARVEAKKIIGDGNDRGEKIIKNAKLCAEREYTKTIERIKSEARVNGEKMILEKKQEIIRNTVLAAYERLLQIDSGRLTDFICRELDKSKPREEGEVLLPGGDSKCDALRIKTVAEKHGLRIGDECITDEGGFMIKYENREENCTFKAILSAKRNEISDVLRDIYFCEGDR